jgi:phospholipid/cholesterol/gamma-HCH transport system substrate-binding protein
VRTAIRKHLVDFVAVLGLMVVALAVSVVILSHERLVLPAWVPVIGKDFFVIKAQLATAQAVTPGQGQTVNIAGVQVGEISKVELKDGRAIVTLRIEPKYDRVYRNATVLLRPKTGLKDMVAELNPGTRAAGPMNEGDTIPVSQTLPDVNLDEILSSLDGDTRQFLQLLLSGGAQGLRGEGGNLSNVLRRFKPTARELARVNDALAQRRTNIRRAIHNFSLVVDELGSKDAQIANFVQSSNAVFETLANEDSSLRSILQELPSTLQETNKALNSTDAMARELGPTLQALRPGARALGPSLRDTRPFLRSSTPIIRDEIRPFVRAARPAVSDLRPALRDLAAATPDLTGTFKVVNALLNTLAYNPPGDRDEGFLFWLSWANHLGNTVFATQDANGPIRHGVVVLSCNSAAVLRSVAQSNELLGVLVQLLRPPDAACPTGSQAPGAGGG